MTPEGWRKFVGFILLFVPVTFLVILSFFAGERIERDSWMKHPPTYVEIQCDAFDVHLYPHDEASQSDAMEFAEGFSVEDVRCRAANRPSAPDAVRVQSETVTVHP